MLSFSEGESGSQITEKYLVVLALLDGSENRSINGLLVSLSLLGHLVLGLSIGEDVSSLLSRHSLSLEIVIIDVLGDLDSRNVNLGLGGNNEGLGDSSEGEVVQFVRSCDEKKSGLLELLEEDDALSLMATSQDNENSSRDDRLAKRSSLVMSEGEFGSLAEFSGKLSAGRGLGMRDLSIALQIKPGS